MSNLPPRWTTAELTEAAAISSNQFRAERLASSDAWEQQYTQARAKFEKLFEVLGNDGDAVAELMSSFRSDGTVSVSGDVLALLQGEFDCGRLDDESAAAVIRSRDPARVVGTQGEVLASRRARGVRVRRELRLRPL